MNLQHNKLISILTITLILSLGRPIMAHEGENQSKYLTDHDTVEKL